MHDGKAFYLKCSLAAALLFLFSATCALAQAPSIEWQKSYGGTNSEMAWAIRPTPDGGYITCGRSSSINGDISGHHGDTLRDDYWVVKLNDTGAVQWQVSLGGDSVDDGYSVEPTMDGGYIVAGFSRSREGDMTGNHDSNDYWIVKLSGTGVILWQKSFGGSSLDQAYSITETMDSGYIIAGMSASVNGDVSGNHGGGDDWIVKINDTGAIQWQKCLGGSGGESATVIRQTADGGYIVGGNSSSNDGDVSFNHGSGDYWIVKLNDTGAIQWQKSFGGSNNDYCTDIRQTKDGGYIISGWTTSMNGDVSGYHGGGGGDGWIVKINDTGAIQWQRCLGGTNTDEAYAIIPTIDGGYLVGGTAYSNNGDVSGNHGDFDVWIVKLNDTGALQWQKCFGGGGNDELVSMEKTSDGGYIFAGLTQSNNADVSGNHGQFDYWVVKLTCGLSAGAITGDNLLFCTDTATLHDTIAGGIWSMSNGHATISPSGFVTFTGFDPDTAIYTVTNTCGSVSAKFPMRYYCEGAVHPVNNIIKISVSPNPTTGTLTISGVTNPQIKIYNAHGQLIKSVANAANVSLSEYPAGLYFLQVFDRQGILLKQEKVVKE